MKSLAMTATLASLLLIGGSAAGGNPWNLRCSSKPTERPAPAALRAEALRFFPWVRPAAEALHSGPVYLVALSSKTAISRDGDSTDGSGYYLHRALIAVAPRYQAREKRLPDLPVVSFFGFIALAFLVGVMGR